MVKARVWIRPSKHGNDKSVDCKINIHGIFKTFKDKNFFVNQLCNVSWLIRSIIYKKLICSLLLERISHCNFKINLQVDYRAVVIL